MCPTILAMGPKRSRKHVTKFGGAIAVTLVLAICLSVGSSNAKNPPARAACTWGASSITATSEAGDVVVSKPATSGCAVDSISVR
jgi:hypothetical protein